MTTSKTYSDNVNSHTCSDFGHHLNAQHDRFLAETRKEPSHHGVPSNRGAMNLDRGLGLVFSLSVRPWDVTVALKDVSSGHWVNIMPFSSPKVAQRVSVDCWQRASPRRAPWWHGWPREYHETGPARSQATVKVLMTTPAMNIFW